VVSFSGGKDSTAVLNTALVVAKELGRLPLDVVFFDEEAIHPPTIEYVERVRQAPRH
jgi:predicted phosphoadenosine phosphosulfate sulfurtransferase